MLRTRTALPGIFHPIRFVTLNRLSSRVRVSPDLVLRLMSPDEERRGEEMSPFSC